MNRSACLFKVSETGPNIIFVAEQFVSAPVNGVDLSCLTVGDCGHCEGEAINGHLHIGLGGLARIHVQSQALVEVLAAEATHDDDRVAVLLSCTKALSCVDRCHCIVLIANLNLFPKRVKIVKALLDIESLDTRNVPFCHVGNTGEDVGPLVIEFATGMVVSAINHHGKILPNIVFNVIKLSLASRKIDIFP